MKLKLPQLTFDQIKITEKKIRQKVPRNLYYITNFHVTLNVNSKWFRIMQLLLKKYGYSNWNTMRMAQLCLV